MVVGRALLGALVIAGASAAQPARPATGLLHRSYDFAAAGKPMPYQLYVPTSYDGTRAVPLVMVLHGAGGDEKSVFAGSALAAEAERRGMIVVAPLGYNAFGGWGDIYPTVVTKHTAEAGAERLKALSRGATGAPEERSAGMAGAEAPARPDEPHIEVPADELAQPDISRLSETDALNVLARVRADYRVDPHRIYLMGNSMGGVGTLFLAARHPELWAAIAPAGGVVAAWSYPVERLKAHRIAALIVHGEKDEHAHWSRAKALADAGRAAGADVRLLVVPDGSHGRAWAMALPQTFDFFLAHRRMGK
jgi:poly(3-hydroxybutyrate) depolymerase